MINYICNAMGNAADLKATQHRLASKGKFGQGVPSEYTYTDEKGVPHKGIARPMSPRARHTHATRRPEQYQMMVGPVPKRPTRGRSINLHPFCIVI